MRKKYRWMLPLVLCGLLCGCEFKSGDALLLAPRPSKSYQALQAELEKVLESGATYAAPVDGENRNTVQLVDLNGDYEEEAVAFFRREDAEGSRFEVIVYRKQGDAYVQVGMVSGVGTAIDHVSYPKLGDDGTCGLLVSWQLAGKSGAALSVADYREDTLNLLLEKEYSAYSVTDIDADGAQELALFSLEGTANKRAQLYDYDPMHEVLQLVGDAAMSSDVQSVRAVNTGYIGGSQPAIFVEQKTTSGVGQQTDIFIYHGDVFSNIALDSEDEKAQSTYRVVAVDTMDINGDGMWEVPRAVLMPGYLEGASDALYMLDWYLYQADATPTYVQTSFRNTNEYWSFIMPRAWYGKVQAVKSFNGTTAGTTFWALDGEERIPLLEIYYFTGDLRNYYASQEGMIALGNSAYATYAAHIPDQAEQSSLAMDTAAVQENFDIITAAWNT